MRACLLVTLLCACYRPHVQGGQPCVQATDCPLPLACVQGVCGGPAADAGRDVLGDAADARPGDACGGAFCGFAPSNGVDPTLAASLTDTIVVSGSATFDCDQGSITGAIARGSGSGVIAGIGFATVSSGGGSLGVFSFHALDLEATGSITVHGSRPVVLVIGEDATLHGAIDVSAVAHEAGPGGGDGATYLVTATGCGGAGGASSASNGDSGGGGGGGGAFGGTGGASNEGGILVAGGAGGAACVAASLVPLAGGGGGAGGGPGSSAGTSGGGGGGAIQISALGSIALDGTIDAAGGGGDPGTGGGGNNAGGGAGGGGGGSILLEAPLVMIDAAAIVAANGGGGGGGGAGSGTGQPGQPGQLGTTPAAGGAPVSVAGAGGAGGALGVAAGAGADSANLNGGGGGGAVGTIYLRAHQLSNAGTFSPAPGSDQL
jgi:hypothetical protein